MNHSNLNVYSLLKILKALIRRSLLYISNRIIAILSILLLKNFKRTLVILREDRIGHQAGNFDIEIFKAEERLLNYGTKTIFLFATPSLRVSNLYLRDLIINTIKSYKHSYIILKESVIFENFLIKLFSFHVSLLKHNKYFYFGNTDIGPRLKKQIVSTSKNFNSLIDSLGINRGGYICIYSRDQKYLMTRFPEIDCSYHNYRNSDINNFKLVSQYITSNNIYNVVRVGSEAICPLNWTNKGQYKIIDYSSSKLQNPKNDLDIISGCDLYFSNGGGPESIAIASRRELIRINIVPLADDLQNSFGLWMPKLHISSITGEYLSLVEICKLNLQYAYKTCEYESRNIILQENSGEEILECFKDYIKYKSNTFTDKDKSIIQLFHSRRLFLEKEYGVFKNSFNFIAPSFLRKYNMLLK